LGGIDLRTAPYLHGYVATRAKPAPAQVILESDLGEPLLARWHVGLGWSLAWTSDVKNRWAVDWLRWSGYSRFWGQLVREHMRQRRREQLDMRAEVVDGEVRVLVDAVGQDDRFMNGLQSTVTLRAAGALAAPEEHPLLQTAPGRYEARFPIDRYGSFVLSASHRRDDRLVAESTAQLNNPYPREYATLEPDITLLDRVAAITRGKASPSPAEIFDPQGESVESHDELWPELLFLALGIFLADLLLRRVRLFDRRFGRPLATLTQGRGREIYAYAPNQYRAQILLSAWIHAAALK